MTAEEFLDAPDELMPVRFVEGRSPEVPRAMDFPDVTDTPTLSLGGMEAAVAGPGMTAEEYLDAPDDVPAPPPRAGFGGMTAEEYLDAPDEAEADDDLTLWEKMKARWKVGDNQAAADQNAYRAATGQVRWEDVSAQLDVGEDERAEGGNMFSEAFLSAVQMVPAMGQGMVEGMTEGAKFGAAGAAAALVGGQLGPQALAPEELVTVPGVAVAGFSVGNVYGSAKYWYQQGAGSFYHTLRKEGVPHNVASPVSQALGLPYAAIEFAQVTKLVPGLKDVAGKVVGATLRASLANLAKAKGREYGEQIGQEVLQEAVGIAAERLGETISGVEPPPDKIPAWERLWNTATEAAKTMPFLMGPKAVTDTVATVRRTKAAQADGARKLTAEEYLDAPDEAQASGPVPPEGGESAVKEAVTLDEADAGGHEVPMPDGNEVDLEVGNRAEETLAATPALEYPTRRLPVAADLRPYWDWFKENLEGVTVRTPIGRGVEFKRGHFLKLIAGGKDKGFIPGAKDWTEIVARIEAGEVRLDDPKTAPKGFDEYRARNMPLLVDVLERPQMILRPKEDDSRLIFLKRFQREKEAWWQGVLVDLAEDRAAIVSWRPRKKVSADWLREHWLVWPKKGGVDFLAQPPEGSNPPGGGLGETRVPESNVLSPATDVNPDAAYMPKPPGYRAQALPLTEAGEALAPDLATAPRHVEWLKPETKGNPSLREIRRYLKRALDVPIRKGMNVSRGAQSALGVYRIRPETIRLRALNDIPTLLHEVGHYLHHMVFPTAGDRGRASDFAGAFDGELMPLGSHTSLPSYTPQMVRMEGVAEWFRTWVADPAAGRMLAPKFAAHFDAAMRANHPEMERVLRSLQQKVRQYVAQPTKAKAMGMIQWEPERVGEKFTETLKRKYTEWFHELAPIERAMDKLVEFGLPEGRALQVVNLANNYKGGWKSKADFDLEFTQTDLYGKEVGPGLKPILAKVDDLKEFATYAALKRAVEKRRQGVTTGFEDVMRAKDFPAMMKDWEARFEKPRQELVRFTENQMRMLEQAGLLSADQVRAMREANKDYVPFYRVVESLGGGGRKAGKGFANVEAGVMRMRGSDLEIANPIESVTKNTLLFRELAERNRVGLEFVKAVNATQGGGRVGETLLRPLKTTKVNDEEVRARLSEVGLTIPPSAAVDLSFTIYRAAKGANAREGTFEVMAGGKPQVFQVEDKELLRALTLMDSLDAEVFNRFPWLKIARGFTSLLRKGATLTPEFIVRNPFRDQIIAGVYSRYGYVPFVDGFRGVLSMLGKDDVYRDWLKAGGKYGGLYDIDVHDADSLLRAVAAKDRNAVQQAAYLLNPLNVLKHLSYAAELMESGTRISEFRRARQAGLSPEGAAMASKDVTLNFSRSGYKGQLTNKMVVFFNAAVQDLDKNVRTHKERPMAAAKMAFLWITIPSLVCWWLGKDDEEIQALPEWRKTFFWNINLRHVTGVPFILTLPKPFLLGTLYGTSVEKALDLASGRDPNAVSKWFGALMQSLPARADMGLVTMVKPLFEGYANYSFFKGGPIESPAQRALSPELRYTPSTSLVARQMGDKLGVSPLMIDHFVRGWTGGLGRHGTDAIDYFVVATDMMDIPPRPARDPRELPIVRAFAVGEDESTEHVARFYRAMDRAERRIRDYKTLGERMLTQKQDEFWKANSNEIVYYDSHVGGDPIMTHLRRARDELAEINKAMLYVQNQRDWTPDFKRERLRELRWQRNEMAKRAFEQGFHPTDKRKAY